MSRPALAALRRPVVFRLACLALALVLLVSGIAVIAFGAVPIPVRTAFGIVGEGLGLSAPGGWSRAERNIVWELRLPRIVLAAVAGAGLAAVGAILQVLTRNPLADPYLFGVSSGAAFGAVLVILYATAYAGPVTLPGAAFLGALLAMALVFAAARGRDGAPTSERLVLTGVAVAFVLQAATNLLIVGAVDRGADSALFWMMGGFGAARWAMVPVPLLVTVIGLVWLRLRAPSVNALAFGDDTARSLGIDPPRLRIEMFVVTALITGAIVSASGGIGFVGLILPHIARMVVGGDLRRLLPLSALLGALFLVWVDAFARVAFAPREIPLGIVTASIGGVFFLWLMRRRQTG
ncbi:FecCD family ABC transporter permease [Enterovirga rhinocerotis]|uniref:Iron complex transport system permease protein n=1 Tax=Enterovirga rhinocerotis TaxID=1339210 RepID=A0A4R7C876_9HYPH|nr:iron ABC transporter permease [Enterovirga rhinocerotis]TDR93495.1 iron complex transport system permease protein [Enterovirga rhinocerotis]